jgi:hypothetical protein
MAGFFKDYGIRFYDFSAKNELMTDDDTVFDRSKYASNWQPESIGYIRSVRDPSRNDYGSTLDDLSRILRSSPEVKRCLTRRLYEYFVGADQSVDGDYLDYLTEELVRGATAKSSQAFKRVVSLIVRSESYSNPYRDSDQCYDHRPGYVATTRAPCRVASILNRRCISCHGSDSPAGGLDLVSLSQASPTKVYSSIMDRLSTADPAKRMPYLTEMPATETQLLYSWANEQLERSAK